MSKKGRKGRRLVEKTEAHVLVGLLLLLFLLLLSCGRSIGSTASGGGSTTGSRGSSAAAWANVQEQVLDILALKSLSHTSETVPWRWIVVSAHLGEKGSPDGLDVLDLCGSDERLELVGSDLDTVISEDESGVGGGELGGRHCDGCDREIGRRNASIFGTIHKEWGSHVLQSIITKTVITLCWYIECKNTCI
jgi:hypothetical protein